MPAIGVPVALALVLAASGVADEVGVEVDGSEDI